MTMTEAPQVPREDLIRMTTTLRHEEEGNLLVGYAAVFNESTEIDSWEGKFRETIAPGAFRKTLRERGSQVKVLFNHGMDPSIGDKPLGKPRTMREDKQGLFVEVPLDETSYNADIKALLRSGALDGMSFRMTVVDERWTYPDDDLPERTIKEIRLYEFGPVTFPAYAATQAGVRAHAPDAFQAWRSANPTSGRSAGVSAGVSDLPESGTSTEGLNVTNGDQVVTTSAPAEREQPPADPEVTDEQNSGPAEATRADAEDDESEAASYQPAQRMPMSPERRRSQMGQVRMFLQDSKERSNV